MTTALQRSDADMIRAREAEAEEKRLRHVIEAKGWLVSRVTKRNGRTHFAIVKGNSRWYGDPATLAKRVQDTKEERRRQHKELRNGRQSK